ncbi:MAG: cytochrome b [Gammaproteobacteria bacterium]|nr:cytochrome b [Gammaproteobacteria bacterium]
MLKNSSTDFGAIAITLHWVVVLTVIGLFISGLWMTGLDYYDDWYHRAPELHKGIGVLLFILLLAKLVWRWLDPLPKSDTTHKVWEQWAARAAHLLLYVLMFAVMIAGYLIPTADGQPLQVFGLFSVPATLSGIDNQEDIAGEIHELLAFGLVGLAIVHALAALKHHFIDRDRTLKRMLGR